VSLAGLSDLVTQVEAPEGSGITAVSPAGDVDRDGREDVLIRYSSVETVGAATYDNAVLLYGFPSNGGLLDVLHSQERKTVIRVAATQPTVDPDAAVQAAVAGGEDVNGDNIPDLLVTSPFEPAVETSALLLIAGGLLPDEVRGADIGESVPGSFIYYDGPFGEAFGSHVTLSEDINGDGLGEIVLWSRVGATVIVLFGRSDFPLKVNAARAGEAVPGFRFEASDTAFFDRAASVGDIDGDGLAELGTTLSGRTDPIAFVIFGRRAFPAVLREDSLPQSDGVAFVGFSTIAGAGDIGGDGTGDLLLGSRDGTSRPTATMHIIDGRPRPGFPPLVTRAVIADLAPRAAILEPYEVQSGTATSTPRVVAARGRDIDSDGRPELLLGAPVRTHAAGPAIASFAGAAYLLPGSSGLQGQLEAAPTAAQLGLEIDGVEPEGQLGTEGFLVDDFTGDGKGDLLLISRQEYCRAAGLRDFTLKLWLVSGAAMDTVPEPRLGMVFPESSGTRGGELVLLHGAGFTPQARVHFGQVASPSVQVLSSGSILAETPPAQLPGTVQVRVEAAPGIRTPPVAFEYKTFSNVAIEDDGDRRLAMSPLRPAPESLVGAGAGDFNGDAKPDVALLYQGDGLFLVFGDGQHGGDVVLDPVAPPSGVMHLAFSAGGAGTALAAGGDLDSDGRDDLVLRAMVPQGELGAVPGWLFLAGREFFPTGVPLEAMDGTARIFSSSGSLEPGAAAIVSDASGDGHPDLLLSDDRRGGRSILYVVKGAPDWSGEAIDLDFVAEQGRGARLEIDVSLARIAGALGDFNGDGTNDIFFAGRGVLQEGAVVIAYGGSTIFTEDTLLLQRGILRLADPGRECAPGPPVGLSQDEQRESRSAGLHDPGRRHGRPDRP
jgi:hypothetical protein